MPVSPQLLVRLSNSWRKSVRDLSCLPEKYGTSVDHRVGIMPVPPVVLDMLGGAAVVAEGVAVVVVSGW